MLIPMIQESISKLQQSFQQNIFLITINRNVMWIGAVKTPQDPIGSPF